MKILDKILWIIFPIALSIIEVMIIVFLIVNDSDFNTIVFSFVAVLFLGAVLWLSLAISSKQGPVIEGIMDAITIWIRKNEKYAHSFLGVLLLGFIALSIAWGISIYSAEPTESIKFLKATLNYEITLLVFSFLGMMLIAIAKFKKEDYLSSEIVETFTPEFIEKGHQAAIEYAFSMFEDKLRYKINASHELLGEDLINGAFGGKGVLLFSNVKNEQQGIRNLFSGSYAVFRNPRKHRVIKEDLKKTKSIINLVDLLMYILDEIPEENKDKTT